MSKKQLWALKIVAFLNLQEKGASIAHTFGFMEGGVHISISDLLLTVSNLVSSGFVSQDSHRALSLTESGKILAKKIPARFGR